ncbi:cell cycle checkpoint control protein RAD9A-like [Chenopodium quinoa]|uniref:cell cycle checkpoint control protein RAD9A-like n=1 Tax=Chenopodium quinoa TaxID=63459 RepID=UPI000B76D30D|nr:cell cycle checkpoint control protein RAD9A-like [Chenopodium quinoa]XP_021742559.1 cell cycle checkpoint control protein RAD9A-like [Chenopodium quinoa]XP_021742560.1 cell cycle checkpoint control protein RAD9A-like [Chenopodium quinoa]
MEVSVSGNALKTFARSINCLAKIGNELAIQASSSQLAFYTLNASRSAYQSISFKPDFFDVCSVPGNQQVQFSILLKAVCAVLRTPLSNIDHLKVHLLDADAAKVKWTLDCVNGMRKTYWINCNVEPDIQHLSLDRGRFTSSFVVRPHDLNRLLSNFQSSLHEITIIATEPSSIPSEAESEIGGKAVELRSYIDPTNDSGSSLHTQLWIDPVEEFLQYAHTGNPVDVTFGVKELKAFLSFCEACEVDIHLFFDKAGEPILMTPKFGLDDDGSTSNFDAKLVLATMLTSQLREGNPTGPVPSDGALNGRANNETGPEAQQERSRVQASAHASEHTKIWSDLSASGPKSVGGSGSRPVQGEGNTTSNEQREFQKFDEMQISEHPPEGENAAGGPNSSHHMETVQRVAHQGLQEKEEGFSQRHPRNWVDADEDEDEEDNEMCVQSTPPYYEEQ